MKKGKKENTKKIIILVILLLILGVSVGYAALEKQLTITGKASITKATWDVHFTNVKVTEGGVDATTDPTLDGDKTVSLGYNVTLAKPGDFYEFTVDVTNAGSINAKLSATPQLSGLSTAQQKYVNYTVTYSGTSGSGSPKQNDTLDVGATKTIKVRVEFKKEISETDLPSTAETLNLVYHMDFIQNEAAAA